MMILSQKRLARYRASIQTLGGVELRRGRTVVARRLQAIGEIDIRDLVRELRRVGARHVA